MGVAVAAHALDQEMQVDLLMAKITSALKADKASDALPFFAELEGMESTLKNPLPESFHFYYIDTLDKTGDKAKALSRADVYLNKYGKSGKYYGQVIEIMSRLQEQMKKEQEKLKPVSQGGLTWMRTTYGYTWAKADSYCTNTTINGQTGWRLPTKNELIALYHSDAARSKKWTLSLTWSSTPGGSGEHYRVDLDSGEVSALKDTPELYMTCVR